VDKARLRENARIVRTVQGELSDLYQVQSDRQVKEWLEKMRAGEDRGADDEETRIGNAEAQLLGVLTKSFLELTEEIAGDIDQDIRP
jgi:DNA primase